MPLDEPVTIAVSYAANAPKQAIETLSKAHPPEGVRREPIVLDWPDVKTTAFDMTAKPVVAAAPGAAATPSGTAPGSTTPALAPAPVPQPGNPLASIFSLIVSLAFVGGVGYFIYRAYDNGKLSGVFQKLGINVSEPQPQSAAATNPFAKPERAPITPITDGTADPLAGGYSASAGAGYGAPASSPRLVANGGVYNGSIFPIVESIIDIGRDPSCGVSLANDTNVSRKHATLRNDGGQFSVTDNGSSNGTFVNGVRIAAQTPVPLSPGDEATIGGTRFRLEA